MFLVSSVKRGKNSLLEHVLKVSHETPSSPPVAATNLNASNYTASNVVEDLSPI